MCVCVCVCVCLCVRVYVGLCVEGRGMRQSALTLNDIFMERALDHI